MIATETIEVRNLRDEDHFSLDGFPHAWKFDNQWCWVALEQEKIVGAILAAPCHGVVIIQIVYALKGHGRVLPRLFRKFLSDCFERNFRGYMAYCNLDKPEQGKLLRIAKRAKATIFNEQMVCFGGTLYDALQY